MHKPTVDHGTHGDWFIRLNNHPPKSCFFIDVTHSDEMSLAKVFMVSLVVAITSITNTSWWYTYPSEKI